MIPAFFRLLCPLLFGSLAFISPIPAQAAPAAAPQGVQLLGPQEWLSPTSTLELRFPTDMVSSEQLGTPLDISPLVITPAWHGKFIWLSKRSGVYSPEVAPRMASFFTLTLLPNLTDLAGQPVAPFKVVLKTTAFGITTGPNPKDESVDLDSLPQVKLAFNRNVQVTGAADFFHFVDDKGHSIAASVRYCGSDDYFPTQPFDVDWELRWKLALHPELTPPTDPDDDSEVPAIEAPQLNKLIVTPIEPLQPGSRWRLEVKVGLPSLTGGFTVPKPRTFPLGVVTPFTVQSVTPSSVLNGGRSVTVSLSKQLGPDVVEATAGKFFRLVPEPKNLAFELDGAELVIRGEFERETAYKLEVSESLLSSSAMPISGERSYPIQFELIKPRLYLPEITGHQILGGIRKFPARSVNLKSLRVRAVLVAPEQAAQAIAAFDGYHKEFDQENPDEAFQALAPDAIPGRPFFEKEIPIASPKLDARQETLLNWDEILGSKKAGIVFLTVEGQPLPGLVSKRVAAQALIQLTDLGVLWKKDAAGLHTNVFSMATGKPVAGARLRLLDAEHKPGPSGTTDASGEARLQPGENTAWLVVQNGSDTHVLSMGSGAQELPMAAFRLRQEPSAWNAAQKVTPLRALLFTDRPLYHPGEKIHVKGLVREAGGNGLSLAQNLEGTLILNLPGARDKREVTIRTDDAGAFDVELALDATTVGAHFLQLKFAGHDGDLWQPGFSASFQVADFQPNAFELTLSSPAHFEPETPVRAELTGKYFFGGPLGAAHALWTLQLSPSAFAPTGFDAFTFSGTEPTANKALTLSGSATLSQTGTLTITPKLPEPGAVPSRGLLTIEVTDINQQTVSGKQSFVRDSSSFYIGLKLPEEGVIGHQQDITAQVIALRPDGQPVPEPVSVKVELVRVHNETVRLQGAGKAVSFRTEKREEIVEVVEKQSLVPVRAGDGWGLPPGETARFTPGKAGEYQVRATAHDAKGRLTQASFTFTVSGSEPISWDYRHPAQVDLVPNKPEYSPGETAKILLKTPISGEALLTVERRDRILRKQHIHLDGNAPVLEVPIEAGDAPNVFVSLTLIRGAEQSTRKFKVPEYRYGTCQLHVSNPATPLHVELKPELPKVEPGREIATTIVIKDGTGAPVSNARVTFFAVDDGILSLTGYQRPQPRTIFEAPFPLGVSTGLTLYELLAEDPADLQYANKGYLIGGGGGGGAGLRLRTHFPGTACWFPSLLTDEAGRVTVRFMAPDALTRYRLVAVAYAGANQFGSAESAVEIHKPFLLLSGLGQGANKGDEILARAVVRNDTGHTGTVDLSLELDATAEPLGQPLTAHFELKNGESRPVDIPVRLREMGQANWKWTARLAANGKTFEDALVASLKIGSPVPVLRETYLSDLREKTNDLLVGVNPQLLEGSGSVSVTLSNTRLASLNQGARELLTYPYGCAEQTVSALIPWVVVNELGPVLPDLPTSKDEIRKGVEAGVSKLFAQQTPSGGLSYWPGGRQADLFASAYATMALGILQMQGTQAPSGWKALLEYLSGELRHVNDKRAAHSLDEYALTLLALATANAAEPAYHEQLLQRQSELSLEGRALLACAILQAKGKTDAIPKLLDPKAAAPDGASFFGSATRERAIRLMAWCWFKPQDREVERLVKELLQARVNGHWRTTQENAWALLGLSRYFGAVEREIRPVTGSLSLGGSEKAVSLSKKTPSTTQQVVFNPTAPLGVLQVSNPAKGNLYGETSFEVRPPVAAQPRQDRGFAVSRSYNRLAEGGKLEDVSGLHVGDRVLVTLRVELTVPGHFVAIDDPLPALLEAINPEFRSQAAGGAPGLARAWVANYREIRSDRVLYFCDHLPAGAYTFQYLARVRTAGKVAAPATKVEEMYRPEHFGLSPSELFQALPR